MTISRNICDINQNTGYVTRKSIGKNAMKKIVVLCVDGLDPDQAREFGLKMPHEASLDIPSDLTYYGNPHTMHIWPSMFAGRIVKHPALVETTRHNNRLRARKWLVRHGIKWKRKGLKFQKWEDGFVPKWNVFHPSVEETVLDKFSSFKFDIPGVSEGVILGASLSWQREKHEHFKLLARSLVKSNFEIVAVYSHVMDHYGHFGYDLEHPYREIFMLARELELFRDVIVVSDHGCVNGKHTFQAYLGCTWPFEAKSVLDVADVIEQRLTADE